MCRARAASYLLTLVAVLTPFDVLPQAASGIENSRRVMQRAEGTTPTDGRPISSFNGPVLGFVFDPLSHTLRSILGIPGASTLGSAVYLGPAVTIEEISPWQDFAIATLGNERLPAVLRLSEEMVSPHWIEGALPAPAGVFLSPSGTAAALYYENDRRFQIVGGLPRSPAVVGETDLLSFRADLTVAAVSDDARVLLLGFSEAEAGSVFLLTTDAVAQLALRLGQVSAITFLSNSHRALVADRENASIYLIEGRAEALQVSPIATARDGLSSPTALTVSGDNQRAFVLDSGGTIVSLDLAGAPPRFLSCPCQPTGLHRLMSNSVFRLTELSADPMWLLDGEGSEPRVVFVPSGRPDVHLDIADPRDSAERSPR